MLRAHRNDVLPCLASKEADREGKASFGAVCVLSFELCDLDFVVRRALRALIKASSSASL
jgi:hypothetical protein